MGMPEMRQKGGGQTITCALCHLPASFVWENTDYGLIDDNADVNPHWPIEVEPMTPTCLTCEDLIDTGQLVELLERARDLWINDLGGEPNRPGWREQSWETSAARLAAWLARRSTFGPIPWEEEMECVQCVRDTWHHEDWTIRAYRCSTCGLVHPAPLE